MSAVWRRGCVNPSRDNTEKADYCCFLILLLKQCSDKYEGRVTMCVKASDDSHSPVGCFHNICIIDSYYFIANDNCCWRIGQTTYHPPPKLALGVQTVQSAFSFFLRKLGCSPPPLCLHHPLHLCCKCIQFGWAPAERIKVGFTCTVNADLH